MLRIYKNIYTLMFVFILMAWTQGLALGAQYTIDAQEDAGILGETAFLEFRSDDGTGTPLYKVTKATDPVYPGWTSYSQVIAFADSKGIRNWWLYSNGNIWSDDTEVGDTVGGLSAGIYRISPLSGGFLYTYADNYQDNYHLYRWALYIQVDRANGSYADYVLGSEDNAWSTAAEAFNAISGQYLDITLAAGDSLRFWLWDPDNSIDNSGSLTFDVSMVPEPSVFILLVIGLVLVFLLKKHQS